MATQVDRGLTCCKHWASDVYAAGACFGYAAGFPLSNPSLTHPAELQQNRGGSKSGRAASVIQRSGGLREIRRETSLWSSLEDGVRRQRTWGGGNLCGSAEADGSGPRLRVSSPAESSGAECQRTDGSGISKVKVSRLKVSRLNY